MGSAHGYALSARAEARGPFAVWRLLLEQSRRFSSWLLVVELSKGAGERLVDPGYLS